MAKRRLPPIESINAPLYGPTVKSVTVGEWVPEPNWSGPPVCVALSLELEGGHHLVCRIKSPEAVDDLIQMLLRHKRRVWPEAK